MNGEFYGNNDLKLVPEIKHAPIRQKEKHLLIISGKCNHSPSDHKTFSQMDQTPRLLDSAGILDD